MSVVVGILKESYFLILKISPYLLFGFLFAGVLHVFVRTETIARHLGKNNAGAVFKASLFGIPLPLCSCGVIPAALSLRKEGASKGATLSFLISTPTTGVDSIALTLVFFGTFFTFYRIGVSFLAAMSAGLLTNFFVSNIDEQEPSQEKGGGQGCPLCHLSKERPRNKSVFISIKEIVNYAFVVLLKDSYRWLLLGVLAGGIISFFVPQNFFRDYIGGGFFSFVFMTLVGVPMYICASGSIPIAMSLMTKGLTFGGVFAFLFAGAATNTITLAMIFNKLGKRAFFIYVFIIISNALFFGWLMNICYGTAGIDFEFAKVYNYGFPGVWVERFSAIVLVVLIFFNIIKQNKGV